MKDREKVQAIFLRGAENRGKRLAELSGAAPANDGVPRLDGVPRPRGVGKGNFQSLNRLPLLFVLRARQAEAEKPILFLNEQRRPLGEAPRRFDQRHGDARHGVLEANLPQRFQQRFARAGTSCSFYFPALFPQSGLQPRGVSGVELRCHFAPELLEGGIEQ